MTSLKNNFLSHIGILVTRPSHQAYSLVTKIEAAGGHVALLPTIEIIASHGKNLDDVIHQLAEFDIAIFISVNAVEQGLARIDTLQKTLPQQLTLACVGPASAIALREAGFDVTIVPATVFNSESLLAHDALQSVAGKRIVIFRGEGGRELLATTLRERGAKVEYAECYRRQQPKTDTHKVERDWQNGDIDLVVVTSGEGLKNLHSMLSSTGKQLLANTPVITVSERTQIAANELGLAEVMVTIDASDDAIIEKLRAWRRTQKAL